MLTELQRPFDRLEDARQTLIRKVRELDARTLHHKAAPERWSILEDIQHLVMAEQRTAFRIGAETGAGEKNPEMLAMVLQVLDQDMVVDVPDPEMVPDGDAGIDDLIRDWDQARKDLLRFLNDCGPNDLEMAVSHHVVAGTLTVVELLRLLESHFHHHRRRIEAALAKWEEDR